MSIATSWGLLQSSATPSTGVLPPVTGSAQTTQAIIAESGSSASDKRYISVARNGFPVGLAPVFGGSHVASLTAKSVDALVVRAQQYLSYSEDGTGDETLANTWGSAVLDTPVAGYPQLGSVSIRDGSFKRDSIFVCTLDFTATGLGPRTVLNGAFANGTVGPTEPYTTAQLANIGDPYLFPKGCLGTVRYSFATMVQIPSTDVQIPSSVYIEGAQTVTLPAGYWTGALTNIIGDVQVPAVPITLAITSIADVGAGSVGSTITVGTGWFYVSCVQVQFPTLCASVLSKDLGRVTFVGPLGQTIDWFQAVIGGSKG